MAAAAAAATVSHLLFGLLGRCHVCRVTGRRRNLGGGLGSYGWGLLHSSRSSRSSKSTGNSRNGRCFLDLGLDALRKSKQHQNNNNKDGALWLRLSRTLTEPAIRAAATTVQPRHTHTWPATGMTYRSSSSGDPGWFWFIHGDASKKKPRRRPLGLSRG